MQKPEMRKKLSDTFCVSTHAYTHCLVGCS